MICKTQILSKERALQEQERYRANFLENNKYTDFDANRGNLKTWLKPREKSVEKSQNMVYNLKNEMDRTKAIMRSQSLKSFEPLSTKMLYDTPFRQLTINKEGSMKQIKQEFEKPFVCTSGPQDQPWEKVPIKEVDEYDPYSPQHEEGISRKRNSLREISQREFDAFSR